LNEILRGKELPIIDGCTLSDFFNEGIRTNRLHPESTALVNHGNVPNIYSYGEFQDFTNRLAKAITAKLNKIHYRNLNEDGETVIAFCVGNSDKCILTIFAILHLKIAYLPIDCMTSDEEVVQIYKSVKPILIIIEDDGPVRTRFLCVSRAVHVVTLGELFEAACRIRPGDMVEPLTKKKRPWNETAAIYYTAGTGGRRKGVRIRHR